MEEKYCSILNNALSYEKRMFSVICIFVVICVLLVTYTAFKNHSKIFNRNKVAILFIIASLLICFIGYAISWHIKCTSIMLDIEEQSFEQYEGEFNQNPTIQNTYYNNVHIKIKNKDKLLYYPDPKNLYNTYDSFVEMPIGIYEGIVVFGHNSNIIVSYYISN